MKLLLDTDIGTNIDDTLCLSYILRKKECELLGITTVTGQPERRTVLAEALCREAGCIVPVFPGAGEPLLIPQKQTDLNFSLLPSSEGNISCCRGPWRGIEFLREQIRRYPHEVTLLTIGPLTNAALLFLMDPEIPSLLKCLCSMIGVFSGKGKSLSGIETNARLDPQAAALVFQKARSIIQIVSLDTTLYLKKSLNEMEPFIDRLEGNELKRAFKTWFSVHSEVCFHDPLAAAVLFIPEICTFEKTCATINITADENSGETGIGISGKDPAIQIASSVDEQIFFQEFFRAFNYWDF